MLWHLARLRQNTRVSRGPSSQFRCRGRSTCNHGVDRQRLGLAEAHRRVLRAAGRRREGAGLAEHAAVEVATGGRAWLQSLQFHHLAGGAADCRQVPGRSALQSGDRRSSRLAGGASAGEEAIAQACTHWDRRACAPGRLARRYVCGAEAPEHLLPVDRLHPPALEVVVAAGRRPTAVAANTPWWCWWELGKT